MGYLSIQKRTRRHRFVAIFCFVLLAGGFVWYARTSRGFAGDAYWYAATPMRIVGGFAANMGYGVKDFFISRKQRENELAALREENRRLQEIISRAGQLRAENDALRTAFNFQFSTFNSAPIMARVVSRGAHIFGQNILLDQGSVSGIKEGDAVIFGERSLIGRVTFATPHHSRVTLLGNRNFRAMVKVIDFSEITHQPPIADSRQPAAMLTEGLVRGEGFGKIMLDMVPSSAVLKEGDIVVTSGFDGLLPPDLVIGKIAHITSGPSDFFQKAQIQPAADMGLVGLVMVLSRQE